MIEHPMITQINRTGYPENMAQQPEHAGVDYFGDEILEGDEIIIDKENGHEIILKENFNRYLSEICGFEFKTAN